MIFAHVKTFRRLFFTLEAQKGLKMSNNLQWMTVFYSLLVLFSKRGNNYRKLIEHSAINSFIR